MVDPEDYIQLEQPKERVSNADPKTIECLSKLKWRPFPVEW